MTATSPDGALAPDRNPLIEELILPTTLDQRPVGAWGYAWIWIGIAVIIATYSLGATGVQGGASLGQVILTIFAANLVLGVFMLLTADIGTEHDLPFAVYLRAPFGIHGTHLPSLSRGLVAAMWFGIQTYLGAIALNGIGQYFLGFDNWVVWYVLFAAVQIVNTAAGIQGVEKLSHRPPALPRSDARARPAEAPAGGNRQRLFRPLPGYVARKELDHRRNRRGTFARGSLTPIRRDRNGSRPGREPFLFPWSTPARRSGLRRKPADTAPASGD